MIPLLAAAAIQSAQVVEWLEPSSQIVSIQAVVKLPKLSERQAHILRLVTGSLGRETATFSENQIADIGGRVGSTMRVTQMPDHIRVSFEVVPADWSTGMSMVGSVVREITVRPEDLQNVADDLQFRMFPYWRAALELQPFEPPKYTSAEVAEVVAAVFRPEYVTLGVGGKITPGLATSKWEDIVQNWKVARPRPLPAEAASEKLPSLRGSVSVIEFRGQEFLATDAALSARLLALSALGTGKSSALFGVSRESQGLSYRQEAVLSPSPGGFTPRLLIATSHKEDLVERADKVRAGLSEAIGKWTEDDKRRAVGMAESFLVNGGEMSPLYFAPGRPIARSLADQVFIRAYWQSKTGARWNPHQVIGRMGFVELPDLKQTALNLLRDAKVVVHAAR
jgi:hypothetical protein